MAMLAFYAGAIVGMLIGMVVMALLSVNSAPSKEE
jgi:hypothetical protein